MLWLAKKTPYTVQTMTMESGLSILDLFIPEGVNISLFDLIRRNARRRFKTPHLINPYALVGDTGNAAVHAAKIGELSLRLNDTPTAVQWLRRAALTAPDNVNTMSVLAEAEFRAGHLPEARAAIERAIQLDPGNTRLRAIARRLS